METATEQALQPETFADMPTDPVPTDPGWFSQLLKGTLGVLYAPDIYGGEPWVDESAYVVPTDNPARRRAMMMGLNTENYEQHMRDTGVLEDKVNTGEMTLGEYHVESAKNLAQIQKDQGGFQANINALTGGALMGAQGAGWQYISEFQKRNDPGYVGDWGDVASRDLAENIQGISEVYGQPYRDIVDRTKAWFQPSTEGGVIDTSVPLTDEINFSGPVQDAARALYDTQQTPVSQALQGVFPGGAPTSLMEEVQPPRSLPIGTPGWQPNIPAQTLIDPAKEAAATMGYMKPEEFGLDPFTNEQIAEARATFQRLMEETPEEVSRYISPTADPYIYQDQVAEALQKAQAEQTLFTGEEVDVASRAPVNLAEILRTIPAAPTISREQEIENMMMEDRAEQLKFHPSSPLYEAPFEEGTGPGAVSPEQPIAQAVAQALANTDQPVQQNLQALVELAQTDPTIAERYVPGSQALQDITTQVESFSEPTVEWTPPKKKEVKKVKKGPTKEEKAATRAANQAANKKLLAEKKEARDIQKAENAAIRAEKLAARESAKQTRDRKAAEQALAVQREHEKMARVEELKRHEQMLRFAEESHKAYLARKKQEDELREAQGYGWGDMFT